MDPRTIDEDATNKYPLHPELTPWALHFGVSTYPYFRRNRGDDKSHSGLAVEYPSRAPYQ